MAIDTYAPCPGGTGKKIKFCCADLVGDLEQLDRLIEGDQVSAALDQVRRLLEKTPGRACLLATRTKLELATRHFAEAAQTAGAFLTAFPDNPLALGQSAVAEAVAGRIQEAAALFDKAREAAGKEVPTELVRIAATLVQAAAQSGHVGFAQGVVDWVVDRSLGNEEEQRLLAAIVGSSGVPVALRTKVLLEEEAGESPWRFEFQTALGHVREWRLAKALTTFRSLKTVAGTSRPLFTNIGILCEMLARPVEASEAWLAVARLPDTPADDAVEATGRAMALETEADPDRSPQVRFTSAVAPLQIPSGEEGSRAIELLEDTLRHDPRCDPAGFDRSAWVSRGAVPPKSAWRISEPPRADGTPARILASLLLFGRQTDREPEAVLQGFEPDVAEVQDFVERLIGGTFAAASTEGLPAVAPTAWLLGSQYRLQPPTAPPEPPMAGQPTIVDTLLARQRETLLERFVAVWPDTPLPELLGKTPRQALGDVDGRRRVEALVTEGEATARRRDLGRAWSRVRERLGMGLPKPLTTTTPLDDVPPLRWHLLDFDAVPLDELRGVFVTALDAGFDRAADLAATSLVSRGEATPADRWEALGVLEERAETSVEKLEIIGRMRPIAKELKANDGMLDVAELRVRLQRGDQVEMMRLLDHLRREHARDQRVLQALAEVLMEAGIDLSAVAGRPDAAAAVAGGPPVASTAAPAAGIWTPGGATSPPPAGEGKKVIWTPG